MSHRWSGRRPAWRRRELAARPAGAAGRPRAPWGIAVGRAYDGGTEAYVAEATRADGTPAVVKLMIPRAGDHARHEITVLRLAGGDGCVELLAADESRGAMLLERLGPSLFDLAVPYRAAAGDPLRRRPQGVAAGRRAAHRCARRAVG